MVPAFTATVFDFCVYRLWFLCLPLLPFLASAFDVAVFGFVFVAVVSGFCG
jgi:hypothetical protein